MNFAGAAAVEFNALTLLGGTSVNITVNGNSLGSVAVGTGRNIGIIGAPINTVDLFDSVGGAEGVQAKVCSYLVPAPGTAALLAVGGLVATRRRR